MHTEWGSFDVDLSSFNSSAEPTTNVNAVASADAMFAALGTWTGTVILATIVLKASQQRVAAE